MSRQQFVVLTLPRTGSYLLVNLLNQISGVRCHPEIFKPDRIEVHPEDRQRVSWTKAQRDRRPIRYMLDILSLETHATSGFKLFPQHNRRILNYILEDNAFQKVILVRHPVSRFISRLRAEKTGQWVLRANSKSLDVRAVAVDFDPERFERFLQHHRYFLQLVNKAMSGDTGSYLIVTYEDVVSLRAMQPIAHHLGVHSPEPERFVLTLQKQTTEPLEALISNYQEMKSYLSTKHTAMLAEPGAPVLL